MTVDELARRAGSTTRNIRSYQTLGLLPAPAVVGRVGYYDEGHLGRMRLIARLQEQGFSRAGIVELLRAWEQGRSLGDMLGFEEVLTAPWSDEQPETMTAVELLGMFPEAVTDPALAERGVQLGLIEPIDEHGEDAAEQVSFTVPSPGLLRAGAEMVAVGVPLSAAQDEMAALRQDMDGIASRFVGLFERWVWAPFVEEGMPAERLPQVTDALRRLRPLAAVAAQATLAQAMEKATAASAAARMTPLISESRPDGATKSKEKRNAARLVE